MNVITSRAPGAEAVIEVAEAFMRGATNELPENLKTEEEITKALLDLLPGLDPFWPHWIVATQMKQ